MAVREEVIGMLRADHEQVKALFAAYEAAPDWSARWLIAERAFTALEIHSELEAMVFYPAFDRHTTKRGSAWVEDSIHDHGCMVALIEQMQDMASDDPRFPATFQELMDLVEGHIAEEETTMFPAAEAARLDQDEELWVAMQELKQELLLSAP